MSSLLFTNLVTKLGNGTNINFSSDTFKLALVTSSYTPNQDTNANFSDITNEVVATGYTAGGNTVTGQTWTQTSKTVTFSAGSVSWPASTITARAAVLYKSTGTPSTSPVVAYIDFGGNLSSAGSTLTVSWNASGIFTLTVS